MDNRQQEFEALGRMLHTLCEKYNEDYFSMAYVNGNVHGFNNPDKKDNDKIDFFLQEESED